MKIAVLPGDGIGPEVVKQAVRVIKALERHNVHFEFEEGARVKASPQPEKCHKASLRQKQNRNHGRLAKRQEKQALWLEEETTHMEETEVNRCRK